MGRRQLFSIGGFIALAAHKKTKVVISIEMYRKLTDFSNIYRAYRQTAKGRHKKAEVIRYETNLHMQLWWLCQRLEYRRYRIGGYHKFMIYDPKEREIQALSFSDRVFQHLLCDNVLMPYLEPRLIYDNAACRQGKGTHFALDRLEKFMHEHYRKYGAKGYILKFDIRKYFNSIDHEVLKRKLAGFPDEEVRELLYHIIDSFSYTEGKGLPMGNQSSQWFALYYLDRLDRLIKEKLRIKHYVRYMDDGVLLSPDKKELQECLKQMKELVAEERLAFNEKTQIFPMSQGVDFLGWHLYLTDTGRVIRRLRTSNKKRFKRRMKSFQKRYAEGQVTFEEITRSVRSYNGHLRHGDTWRLRKHIYGNLVFVRNREGKEHEEKSRKNKWRKTGSAILIAAVMLLSLFPGTEAARETVQAANALPGAGYWTNAEGLKGFSFSGSGAVGKIRFGAGDRQWAICGYEGGEEIKLVLLSTSPFETGVQYGSTSDYSQSNFVKKINADNYLGTSYFSSGETTKMADVTVQTQEPSYGLQAVTAKLYLPDSVYNATNIKVGSNDGITIPLINLTSIGLTSSDFFWLRSPYSYDTSGALVANPGNLVITTE